MSIFWKEWVVLEWTDCAFAFPFILISSDRQNQDSISFFVPAVFGEKIVSCSCESCCSVDLRATNFISGFVTSNVPTSVSESSCVFLLWSFSCEKQIILMRMRFWNETQKTSICHVFIDWSRYCNLSTRSATYHVLRCALDNRRSSSDFEPSNWYLQLSRKVCHLLTVWWKGRTCQILFLVLCFLSNYNYHCIFLFHKFLVVRKKKSRRRSFGSCFAWNTMSFRYK